jgi:hypothetical protein
LIRSLFLIYENNLEARSKAACGAIDEVKTKRGKIHEYLGMKLDYTIKDNAWLARERMKRNLHQTTFKLSLDVKEAMSNLEYQSTT